MNLSECRYAAFSAIPLDNNVNIYHLVVVITKKPPQGWYFRPENVGAFSGRSIFAHKVQSLFQMGGCTATFKARNNFLFMKFKIL